MADLTTNTERRYRSNPAEYVIEYPVEADTHIFVGMAVSINSGANSGIVPASDAADYKFIGIAIEEVDNSGGAYAAKNIRIKRNGIMWIESASFDQSNIADDVHFDDSNTVAAGAGTSTLRKDARIVKVVDTTEVLIDLGIQT